MFVNLLTSILLSVSFLGCSLFRNNKSQPKERKTTLYNLKYNKNKLVCPTNYQPKNLPQYHLQKRIEAPDFYRKCLASYFKFQKGAKKQRLLKSCVMLDLNTNGTVRSLKMNNFVLPRDLKWCIEQELWSYDYSLFQLRKKAKLSAEINWIAY